MPTSLTDILSAPIANVLILAGLVFLALGVIGKISGRIEPGRSGRIASGVFGAIFVATGLFFYITRPDNGPPPAETPEPPAPTEDVTMTAIEPSPTPESATPTSVPVDTQASAPTPAMDANLLLVYDDIAASVINVSDAPLSLVGVTFRRLSADGAYNAEFAASDWENVSARPDALKAGSCLQVLRPTGDYPRPRACDFVQGFMSISNQDLHFWIGAGNSSEFQVFLHDEIIQTCAIQDGECELYLREA